MWNLHLYRSSRISLKKNCLYSKLGHDHRYLIHKMLMNYFKYSYKLLVTISISTMALPQKCHVTLWRSSLTSIIFWTKVVLKQVK